MGETILPTFQNPPLIETVLGVQFDPIQIQNCHYGVYWRDLGAHWAFANDAPYILTQYEVFSDDGVPISRDLQTIIQDTPGARIQIRNAEKNRMIQFQKTRFHYNWLAIEPGDYPRFHTIFPEFIAEFARMSDFVMREGIGPLRVNQWEVTYVNEIPRGELWESPADWINVFQLNVTPAQRFPTGELDGFEGKWNFEIEPQRGRLHLQIQNVRQAKGQEALRVVFTARGPITDGDHSTSPLEEGLKLGHEKIVHSFCQLTTQRAQEHWGGIEK